MNVPALYDGALVHVRRERTRRVFRHRLYMWLVDLDDLPALPWWARWLATFDARDHIGRSDLSIRQNLDAWLGARGVHLDGVRVLMLTSARVFGHVFNPLTVFWCLREDGTAGHVVAEVHNTYGERHLYLLCPDEAGRARVDKEFHVSPFLPMGGSYHMHLPLPGERLSLNITLRQNGQAVFAAVLSGSRLLARPRDVVRLAFTRPLMPQRVSLLIRRHGIALWARGFRLTPYSSRGGTR